MVPGAVDREDKVIAAGADTTFASAMGTVVVTPGAVGNRHEGGHGAEFAPS